eukprot:SAG31_NODE_2358_length_5873_cov_12.058019_4_plen_64_part_00
MYVCMYVCMYVSVGLLLIYMLFRPLLSITIGAHKSKQQNRLASTANVYEASSPTSRLGQPLTI